MPTGYTADVQSGKVTEFSDFAMQCARAFGALVTMRDDPADAAIPAEFAPSTYNADRLVEAKARLSELQAMNTDQRQAAATDANARELAAFDKYEADKKIQRARYESMIEKVKAWSPPTPDHAGMKSFMLGQLTESIQFDCGRTYRVRPAPMKRDDWYAKAITAAEHDIEYHSTEHKKEIERAASRTAWIAALRQSLNSAK